MHKELIFLSVFILGELISNLTWFKYLKSFFKLDETIIPDESTNAQQPKKFLFMNLSVFKGLLERLILSVGLIIGFAPILIVFGTIKLGTRFKDNQDIKNDYFLIGNFSSILISLFYYYSTNGIMSILDQCD